MKNFNGSSMLTAIFAFFLTAVAASAQAPTVTSTVPAAGIDAPTNSAISATFNTAMDPSTITTSTFTLRAFGVTPVAGTVSYSGRKATFTLTSYIRIAG